MENEIIETGNTPWNVATLPKPTSDAAQLRSDVDTFGYGVIENALEEPLLSQIQERLFEQAHCERSSDIRRDRGESCDPTPSKTAISPPVMANVMWMITPFSVETGATRVVPGSHLSGMAPDSSVPHKVPSIPAEGPAGTAIVFDARLWHSAWVNTSSESRYGITTAFCGPQCRPIENYSRGMRPEAFEKCPPELLQRLGMSVWSSYGHTGDMDACPTGTGEQAIGSLHRSD
jgi:ectoine hydroxylase-related dioxygenase (phytanoyl-CoA dioxygenase family)